MTVVARLAAFLLLAVFVFAGAWFIGDAVGPIDGAQTTTTLHVNGPASTTAPDEPAPDEPAQTRPAPTSAPVHGSHQSGGGRS